MSHAPNKAYGGFSIDMGVSELDRSVVYISMIAANHFFSLAWWPWWVMITQRPKWFTCSTYVELVNMSDFDGVLAESFLR